MPATKRVPRTKRVPVAYEVTVKDTWKHHVFVQGGVIFTKSGPETVPANHAHIEAITHHEFLACKPVYKATPKPEKPEEPEEPDKTEELEKTEGQKPESEAKE